MTGPPSASIMVVLGTRPEIIKLAGIVRRLGAAAGVVHTSQHYDANLSEIFFGELGLPEPVAVLGIGGTSRGKQIGAAVERLDELLDHHRPAAVVVQGDTNTVLAAAVAANAREVPLVHVEAGLRSFDRRMPEEHNRVVTDHLADLLLAPTEGNRSNLLAEGIDGRRIVVTGNTIVEAVTELLPDREERLRIVDRFGLEPSRFVLSTLHRPENVDDAGSLAAVLAALGELPLPVLLPVHPRTVARARVFGLDGLLGRIRTVEPLGYREFLALGAEAAFLVSDSGGVQEEVSVYKRPVVVVRRSTERPEVLGTFAELVPPGDGILTVAHRWLADLPGVHARLAAEPSPFGDGTASARSVAAILGFLDGVEVDPAAEAALPGRR